MNLAGAAFANSISISGIGRISSDLARTVESMHPLRQVMVVLSILVPFQTLIGWLIGFAFIQLLSNEKWAGDIMGRFWMA